MMDKKRQHTLYIWSLVFLLIFLWTLYLLSVHEDALLRQVDHPAMLFMVNLRRDWLTPIVRFITSLGDVWFQVLVVVLAIVILWYKGHRRQAFWYGLLNVLGSTFMLTAFKNVIGRSRPPARLHLVEVSSYSFPSGHSMGSILIYGGLIYIVHQSDLPPASKRTLQAILIIPMVLTPLSRMYLGVHYFTDVLAGVSLGLSWLLFWIANAQRVVIDQ